MNALSRATPEANHVDRRKMSKERYKATIEVADADGRIYIIEQFVTLTDEQEGTAFYRLVDGTPAERVGSDEFEIGLFERVLVTRISE